MCENYAPSCALGYAGTRAYICSQELEVTNIITKRLATAANFISEIAKMITILLLNLDFDLLSS